MHASDLDEFQPVFSCCLFLGLGLGSSRILAWHGYADKSRLTARFRVPWRLTHRTQSQNQVDHARNSILPQFPSGILSVPLFSFKKKTTLELDVCLKSAGDMGTLTDRARLCDISGPSCNSFPHKRVGDLVSTYLPSLCVNLHQLRREVSVGSPPVTPGSFSRYHEEYYLQKKREADDTLSLKPKGKKAMIFEGAGSKREEEEGVVRGNVLFSCGKADSVSS
ncbi:hypothetical protein K0M31_019043 [Melipona bicolor]|uniref:Uncharacterized protein n=1 Tax=Melipona bicolor TaxID=60889 RepID=A0AA40FCI4_9HYME|nr:hypothetical protein K0M31_019043 [Melipona bicolor]